MKDKKQYCARCGMPVNLEKENYFPAHDIEQQKTLIFCSKDCFKEYINFIREIEKDEKHKRN